MSSDISQAVRALIRELEQARKIATTEAAVFDDAMELCNAILDDEHAHMTYGPLKRFVDDSLPWTPAVFKAFENLQKAIRRHRTRHTPLELVRLEVVRGSSNNLALSEHLAWQDFPRYAETITTVIGATVNDRADSPVERVWSIDVRGHPYWLGYDDYTGVSITCQRTHQDEKELEKIANILRTWRDS